MNLVDRIPEIMAVLSAVAAVWWRIDSKFDTVNTLLFDHKDHNAARRAELWKAISDLERRYDQRFLTYVETTASNRAIWRKEVEDAIRGDLDELREGINYLRNRVDTLVSQRAAL